MTNKNKKRRRPAPVATERSAPVDARADRRERKEEARKAREAARKRAQRSALVRRAAVFSFVGVVGVGAFYWLASPFTVTGKEVKAPELSAVPPSMITPVAGS